MNFLRMRSSGKTRVLRVAGSIIALGLLGLLFFQQGWDEILSAAQKITWTDLLAGLCLVFLSRFSVAARWYVLLQATDLDITVLDVLRLTFAGLFGSNFLPTTIGGDLIRLAGTVQLKYDGTITAASLVVDRLVGMTGMALVLPLGVVPLAATLGTRSTALQHSLAANSVILHRFGRLWKKAVLFVRRIIKAISIWKHRPGALFLGLVFTGLHMFFLFSAIYVLLNGMHDPLPLWEIAGLWSIVYFITLLPVSINGFGLQEISISYIYSHVGGISIESSLVVAVLIRTLVMTASIPGAAFVPSIMSGEKIRNNARRKEEGTNTK